MKTSIALAALAVLAGCTDQRKPITGPSTIKVEIVTPVDLGSTTQRLDDTARTVVVNLSVLDADGTLDTSFTNDLQTYVNYLGTLTPYLGAPPLQTIPMVGGKATNVTIMLPPVFGPTTLWFDDGQDPEPTHVTGASLPLWFHDPYIRDIQMPASETALDALSRSPLQNKNIDVNASRYGADGVLVVSSVFAQGYTLQDMNCPGGHLPCTTGPYDSILIFTFSAPQYTNDENRIDILSQGQQMVRFNGGVSEFDGLTEIGFPQNFPKFDAQKHAVIDTTLEPVPVKLQAGRSGEPDNWFAPLSDPQGIINFERYEAAPIEIDNAVVCPLDANYTTYKQWRLDPAGGAGCTSKNVLNVISSGAISDLDPATLVGKTVPRLVGIVRPVSIGSFNVWIVYPRSSADVTLP